MLYYREPAYDFSAVYTRRSWLPGLPEQWSDTAKEIREEVRATYRR